MKRDEFRIQLAQRIKDLRNNLGYSQEEVAKRMGLHRPTISQIESGDRVISAEELTKLAMIYGVTIQDLVEERVKLNSSKLETIGEGDKVITFFRHGEAIDDVYDQYGGWADPEMSPKGINKAFTIASGIKNAGMNFEIIYSSPLRRARQLAEVVGRELKTDVKVMQYLKERNTYGLLSGINKTVAKKRFFDLVKAYEEGKYVLGSEREEDFKTRIPMIFSYLQRQPYSNICCVTHGKILSEVIKQILKMNPNSLQDGCMLKMGIEKDNFYFIQSEGIVFAK